MSNIETTEKNIYVADEDFKQLAYSKTINVNNFINFCNEFKSSLLELNLLTPAQVLHFYLQSKRTFLNIYGITDRNYFRSSQEPVFFGTKWFESADKLEEYLHEAHVELLKGDNHGKLDN